MYKIGAAGALAATAVGTAYLCQVYRQIYSVKTSAIDETDSNPASFSESTTCRSVVNPRRNIPMEDTRSLVVILPESKRTATDEEILASFVKGFFGGWVFTPEQTLMRSVHKNLVHFSSKRAEILVNRASLTGALGMPPSTEVETIWSPEDLSEKQLPALHNILFGAFQVLDRHLLERSGKEAGSHMGESYIDFGFSPDEKNFAGAHRFSARRLSPIAATPGEQTQVLITFSHHSCNPTQNRPLKPDFMFPLHKFYAMQLFREGIAHLLRP